MNLRSLCLVAGLAAATFASWPARADAGHDHGAAPAAAAGRPLPRFAAVSEAFELVGIVDGTRLTVYLDRFDDNAPVKGAQVELSLADAQVVLKEQADGEFGGQLPAALPAGTVAVTATVAADRRTDLLAAELEMPAGEAHAAHAHPPGWRTLAGWAGAALLAAVALLAARRARRGGAA